MALKHTCACEWRICPLLEIHCGRRCTREGSGQLVSLVPAWQTCCAISLLSGYSEPLCSVVPGEEPPLAPRKSLPPRSLCSSTQFRPPVVQEVVVQAVPLEEVELQECLLVWPIFPACGFCCCFVCSFPCWKSCRRSPGGKRIFQSRILIGNEDIQFFWPHQPLVTTLLFCSVESFSSRCNLSLLAPYFVFLLLSLFCKPFLC